MSQVQVNDDRIEAGVVEIANELHISTDDVICRALNQMLEDREDYLAGMRALHEMKYTISAKEMERLSELAD